MRWVVAALLLLWVSSHARAHDLDCMGRPINAAVKESCCGKADAHQITFDKVYEDSDGFWHVIFDDGDRKVVDGDGRSIQPLPSTDGCNWVWYRRDDPRTGMWPADGSGTGSLIRFYCLQIVLGL